ncbi:MAG TPA: VCBS repeat-containing protein [Candidatus Brocadiia bacterium]|nr:VCBS repeat-containing protein [Candidatus Brocadiia bacterium]
MESQNPEKTDTPRADSLPLFVALLLAALTAVGYVLAMKPQPGMRRCEPTGVSQVGGRIGVSNLSVRRDSPTSIVAGWETDVPTEGLVTVEIAGGCAASSMPNPEPTREHSARIEGISALRDARVIIFNRDAGGRASSEEIVLKGGSSDLGFERVTVKGGAWEGFSLTDGKPFWGAWGDGDNDGLPELAVVGAGEGRHSIIMRWAGDKSVDVIEAMCPGLPGSFARSVAWLDVNNDGFNDLACAGRTMLFFLNGGPDAFQMKQAKEVKGANPRGPLSYVAALDCNRDGAADMFVMDSVRNPMIFINRGKAGMADATAEMLPSARKLQKIGFPDVVTPVDVDGDGFTDLVWNAGRGAVLRNIEGKKFEEVPDCFPGLPDERGVAYCSAWGDYDNDGDMDVFIPGGGKSQRGGFSRLYRNEGDFKFADVTESSGDLGRPGFVFHAAAWGDFNNDGLLDLYALGAGTAQDHELFLAEPGGKFTAAGDMTGLPAKTGFLRAATVVDYDRDGDLDVFAVSANRPNTALRNAMNDGGKHPALLVALKGTRGVIGARVILKAEDGKVLGAREVGNCSAMPGQAPAEAHFAPQAGKYKVAVAFTNGQTKEEAVEIPGQGVAVLTVHCPE